MKTPDYINLPIRCEEDPRSGRVTLLEAGGGVLLSDDSCDVPKGIPEWICEAVNAHAGCTEERNKLLNLISELADVASWYAAFHNDVVNTAPAYFDLCADLNAVLYLKNEAQATYERARALITEYAESRRAAAEGRQP